MKYCTFWTTIFSLFFRENNLRSCISLIKNIVEIKAFSERIALLKFKTKSNELISIFQVYAPTSASSKEETKEFYIQLEEAFLNGKSDLNLIMGDFNAKVGTNLDANPSVGPN